MSQATDKNNTPDAGSVSRQTFLRVALGGVGVVYAAGLAYPVYRYVASPVEKAAKESAVTEVTLKDAQKLAPGSALMFRFGSKPSLLIHHDDGTWTALTAVCTPLRSSTRSTGRSRGSWSRYEASWAPSLSTVCVK